MNFDFRTKKMGSELDKNRSKRKITVLLQIHNVEHCFLCSLQFYSLFSQDVENFMANQYFSECLCILMH